jgi:crossover junction endodeoxyribonuclease RusA
MTKMPGEQTLTFDLDLPWPSPKLSPNARQHWATAAKAKKAYRARCRAIATAAGVGAVLAGKTSLAVDLTFFPPDRRGRDMDNMLASMKSGLDGLADATGIDDRHWRLSIGVGEPVKGGQVLVRMSCR